MKTRKEMIEFLKNHFRYNTMNSWNASTSYAAKMKIYTFVPNALRDKAHELLETEGSFDQINQLIEDWEEENAGYTAGFNGRSGGYLVLYHKDYPGRSIDMNEDFMDTDTDSLCERVELVQSFDKLAEDCKAEFIYLCKNVEVKEEVYSVKKTRKVLVY